MADYLEQEESRRFAKLLLKQRDRLADELRKAAKRVHDEQAPKIVIAPGVPIDRHAFELEAERNRGRVEGLLEAARVVSSLRVAE